MKTFLISDTHFNHINIIKYSKRPFKTVKDMNKELIKRWNNTVRDGDVVYHLGDFGLGDFNYIKGVVEKLNGDIILIKGNHDRSATKMKELGFKEVYSSLVIGEYLLTHKPVKEKDLNGFINIHGHTHTQNIEDELGSYINVCVEQINYEPLEFDFHSSVDKNLLKAL